MIYVDEMCHTWQTLEGIHLPVNFLWHPSLLEVAL